MLVGEYDNKHHYDTKNQHNDNCLNIARGAITFRKLENENESEARSTFRHCHLLGTMSSCWLYIVQGGPAKVKPLTFCW